MANKIPVIQKICRALLKENYQRAKDIALRDYPHSKIIPTKGSYSRIRAARIFMRDGFIDRYSGAPLIFPGALMLLGMLLPEEFHIIPTGK